MNGIKKKKKEYIKDSENVQKERQKQKLFCGIFFSFVLNVFAIHYLSIFMMTALIYFKNNSNTS